MRRATLLTLLSVGMAACRLSGEVSDWNPAAARAVARQAAATVPDVSVVVLRTIGGATGAELPWAVRQSLTTGGIEVADSTALHRPATTVLVFESSRRSGDEWIMGTQLRQATGVAAAQLAPPAAERTEWRVRCAAEECEVIDVVQRSGT